MRILDPDAAAGLVAGLVHLDTQRAGSGLDLTVDRVARLSAPGALDFGGSEFAAAGAETLPPERAAPGDDYGWWELEPGTYLAAYNEAPDLTDGQAGLITALPRLQRAGASHPAFVADGDGGELTTLLEVGDAGCRLKENARISRLTVLDAG